MRHEIGDPHSHVALRRRGTTRFDFRFRVFVGRSTAEDSDQSDCAVRREIVVEVNGRTCVVVGVFPHQPDVVVLHAVEFASHFDAEVVCAYVDASRYVVEEDAGGRVRSMPIDPDLSDSSEAEFDPKLAAHLAALLDGHSVAWSTRVLAGDPARALGHLADALDAAMIVVGTREATMRGGLQEFFAGSVAVHLAHRQHRPVVVIPISPVSGHASLPWESA